MSSYYIYCEHNFAKHNNLVSFTSCQRTTILFPAVLLVANKIILRSKTIY